MGEVKSGIDNVLDVHDMVVSNLVKNKSLMNRVSTDIEQRMYWYVCMQLRTED